MSKLPQAPQGELAVQPGQGFRPIAVWPTAKDEASRFVRLDNAVVQNPELSFRARGLLAYVLSMPKDFVHSAERLAKRSLDGVSATRSALRELQTAGYAKLSRFRKDDGTFGNRWEFRESPSRENLHSVNPSPGSEKPQSAPSAGKPTPGEPGFGQPHSGQPGPGKPAPLETKEVQTKLGKTKLGKTTVGKTKCPAGTDNAPGRQDVPSSAGDPDSDDVAFDAGGPDVQPRECLAASGYPEPEGWRDALKDDERLDATDFRLPWGDRGFTDGKKRYVLQRMTYALNELSRST
jgi:hypothetical protein